MKTLLSLFALLLPCIGFAQSAMVRGQVTDGAEGYALPGASVYWKAEPAVGTVTDLNGKFELPWREGGLVISFIGYKSEEVTPEKGRFLSISLISDTGQLAEVEVKAQRLAAEEFTIHKIKQLDVYTNPMAKADPLLAVNALPAATTLDESANVSLRGSGPGETGIFFDQVPIYDAVRFAQLNGIGTFSIFNTSLVSQLNVFPSNPPLEFGNTSSGLISLQTTDQLPEQPTGSVLLSLVGVGAQYRTQLGEKNGLTFFGNFQPSTILTAVNAEALENLKSFRLADAGVHWVHRSGKSVFKVFQYGWDEGYNFRYEHPSFHGNALSEKQRSITIGQWRQVGKRHEFTLNTGFSQSKERFRFGNTDVQFRNRDVYASANLTTDWKGITFKHGLSWDFRHSHSFGKSSQWAEVLHPEVAQYAFDGRTEVSVPEYYSYVRRNWKSGWTLGGGLRRLIPVNGADGYASWQIGLTRQWEKHRITASTGRYHKQHVLRDGAVPAVLFNTQQQAVDYTFTAEKWQFTTAFYRKVSRELELSDRSEMANTETWGAEAFFRFQPSGRLQADFIFSSIRATESRGGRSFAGNYDLDFCLKGTFRYQLTPTFWLNGSWIYRQGAWYLPVLGGQALEGSDFFVPQYAERENQQRLPHYGTLDVSVNKMFLLRKNLGMIVFTSVNNLSNRQNVRGYTHNSDYSQPSEELFSQRTFFVGAQVQF